MKNSPKIPVRFLIVVALVILAAWKGPELLMNAMSYTPPGVQPPKGLEPKVERVKSAGYVSPCIQTKISDEHGGLMVRTFTTMSLAPCAD